RVRVRDELAQDVGDARVRAAAVGMAARVELTVREHGHARTPGAGDEEVVGHAGSWRLRREREKRRAIWATLSVTNSTASQKRESRVPPPSAAAISRRSCSATVSRANTQTASGTTTPAANHGSYTRAIRRSRSVQRSMEWMRSGLRRSRQ